MEPITERWFLERGFDDLREGVFWWSAGAESVRAVAHADGRWWLQRTTCEDDAVRRESDLVTWEQELAGLFGGLLARLPLVAPPPTASPTPTAERLLF